MQSQTSEEIAEALDRDFARKLQQQVAGRKAMRAPVMTRQVGFQHLFLQQLHVLQLGSGGSPACRPRPTVQASCDDGRRPDPRTASSPRPPRKP